MESNICRFVPAQRDNDRINILYSVLETQPQKLQGMRVRAFYTMHLVLEGSALLNCAGTSFRLDPGDIFFTLPASPYSIEADEGFRYIYISYMGPRANMLMEKLGITPKKCVFPGHGALTDIWRSGLGVLQEIVAIRSEAILLYSLSEIGLDIFPKEDAKKSSSDPMKAIKKYVDDNFSDPYMSLETIGQRFSYNPKYISMLFKQSAKVNFTEYLNLIRIQHACAMMEQGFTCIKDIAALCGYRDPMYFSRVFKDHIGVAPRRHCEKLAQDREEGSE